MTDETKAFDDILKISTDESSEEVNSVIYDDINVFPKITDEEVDIVTLTYDQMNERIAKFFDKNVEFLKDKFCYYTMMSCLTDNCPSATDPHTVAFDIVSVDNWIEKTYSPLAEF